MRSLDEPSTVDYALRNVKDTVSKGNDIPVLCETSLSH